MPILSIKRGSSNGARRSARGQSMVEFALILPVFAILFATALDLGRAFYAQISLANAAREAAFQASETPTSFQSNIACPVAPASPDNNLVMCRALLESAGSFVSVQAADVSLTCSPSCTVAQGNTATVTVRGDFQLVTPILSPFFGGSQTIQLSSTATAAMLVMPTRPPVVAPSNQPTCTAPDLVGQRANSADGLWSNAGFTGGTTSNGSGNYTIAEQSPGAGTVAPCTTGVTIWQVATATPTPSSSPTPTPTPSPTPTAAPSGSAAPTPTPTAPGATPTPTLAPTASPSPTPECFTHDGLAGVRPPNVIGLVPSVASSRIQAKGLTAVAMGDLSTGHPGVVQEQNPDQSVCVAKGPTSRVEFHYRP